MNTSIDWINHFLSADEELLNNFLNISLEDCKQVLKQENFDSSKGEAFSSAENRVFGFNDVVIKFYRPGRWSKSAIEEELLFFKDLEKASIPFVRALSDIGEWKGVFYIIFKKVESPFIMDREVLDEKAVRKMVHIVAKMHEVGRQRKASKRAYFNPRHMAEGCFEVIKRQNYIPKNLEKRYREAFEGLISDISSLGDIPIQRIHGDTYSGNILWKSGDPIFMDLDDFQMGPIAIDIRLLSFPWRLDSLPETMDRRERRKKQHEMVVDMYSEVSLFSEKQEKLVPLLGAYRGIQFDAWFSAHWKEPGFAKNYEDDDITKEEYWIDAIEAIEKRL